MSAIPEQQGMPQASAEAADPAYRIRLLAVFRRRAYSTATLTIVLQSMAMFGMLLLLPIYLQSARGRSPTEAGLMILPMSAALVVASPLAGSISDRFGPWLPTVTGMPLLTASMIGFSRLTLNSSYLELAIILVVAGTGIGMSISPVTSTAMNAAQRSERGRASGFFNTLRFLGAVIGSTILSVLLTSRTQAAASHIHASNPHTRNLLPSTQGFHDVFLVAAGISTRGAGAALLLRPAAPGASAPEPAVSRPRVADGGTE